MSASKDPMYVKGIIKLLSNLQSDYYIIFRYETYKSCNQYQNFLTAIFWE
jgi:hypothetical protein